MVTLLLVTVATLASHTYIDQSPTAKSIVANDNRVPGGHLERGVLRVTLVAEEGTWYPERSGPAFPIFAFGEEGKPLQTPGPLIRVVAGTQIIATVRNALGKPMVLHGLNDRAGGTSDSLRFAPGEEREIRFAAVTPGTYYYWGRTTDRPARLGIFEDGQLLGAFVVDAPDEPANDRVLVIALWADATDTIPPRRHTFLVNGLSWPHSERLSTTVGDSVRLRVINATPRSHPMHLHGFYFRVDAKGDAATDSIYSDAERRLAVTELLRGGQTMKMAWIPTRPGNWLFHCHFLRHIEASQRMSAPPQQDELFNHALDRMAGLITGIEVQPRPEGYAEPGVARRRPLRIYANARDGYFGKHPAFSFIWQQGDKPPAPDSILIPGTPLLLIKDEPVEVTVVNRAPAAISVHWHGIELEARYDGVPGWSGIGRRVSPAIAPSDSFIVHFTPNRAGTFIYHTHAEEAEQLASGLYAPLIVLEPGETWYPDTDRVVLVGWGGPGPEAPPLLNGSTKPTPWDFEVGKTYKLRLINITPSSNIRVQLTADGSPVEWRLFAKDGAEVPKHQAVLMTAVQQMGAGETYDFEITPPEPADLILQARMGRAGQQVVIQLPIRIR